MSGEGAKSAACSMSPFVIKNLWPVFSVKPSGQHVVRYYIAEFFFGWPGGCLGLCSLDWKADLAVKKYTVSCLEQGQTN
jgi:hypothetical protein